MSIAPCAGREERRPAVSFSVGSLPAGPRPLNFAARVGAYRYTTPPAGFPGIIGRFRTRVWEKKCMALDSGPVSVVSCQLQCHWSVVGLVRSTSMLDARCQGLPLRLGCIPPPPPRTSSDPASSAREPLANTQPRPPSPTRPDLTSLSVVRASCIPPLFRVPLTLPPCRRSLGYHDVGFHGQSPGSPYLMPDARCQCQCLPL